MYEENILIILKMKQNEKLKVQQDHLPHMHDSS